MDENTLFLYPQFPMIDAVAESHNPFRGLRLHVDDIDSFDKVREVNAAQVSDLLDQQGRIESPEDFVQSALEKILAIPSHKKDWAGEENDVYTANLVVGGQRQAAAFLLKGAGTRSPELRLKDCGHNGDQVVRLFQSPAAVFVVQYVGRISENAIKDIEQKSRLLRHEGRAVSFCILDGQDTARLLRAYGFL